MFPTPVPATGSRVLPTVALAISHIPAGFPSPAQDYETAELDLEGYLIRDRVSTFFVTVSGESMIDAGIADGDIAVVDRGLEPEHGNVVLAVIDGEFTIKRFLITAAGSGTLHPENPAFPDIPLTEETDFQIWGVLTHTLHSLR